MWQYRLALRQGDSDRGEGDNVSLCSVGEILVKFSAFSAQYKANCLTTEGHYSHTALFTNCSHDIHNWTHVSLQVVMVAFKMKAAGSSETAAH